MNIAETDLHNKDQGKERLVSILMPAYNAERYIEAAIRSVLSQTYTNWELVVVNDGSTDRTQALIEQFDDPRIRLFQQANGGIGSARNKGLQHVRGHFLCGLDADDVLPEGSLAARIAVFDEYPDTDIVDGQVIFTDASLKKTLRTYIPSFEGEPFNEIVRLSGRCFMGFSWLIRWGYDGTPSFREDISHGEDLVFYLHFSPGKYYRFTNESVLIYRRTGSSSMADLDGLERSYRKMERLLREQGVASREEMNYFHWRRKRIMAGSYWHAGRPFCAIRALFG